MATDSNTTITDKASYSATIQDADRYDKLTVDEKAMFDLLRNSLLEIFPTNKDGLHDALSLKFAENFAFINLKALSLGINKIIDAKLLELSDIYATKTDLSSLAATASAGASPGLA